MQTAVSTCYIKDAPNFLPGVTKERLSHIADAGITHIQWAFDWNRDYLYSNEEIAAAAKVVKDVGLGVKGVHGSHGVKLKKEPGMHKYCPRASGGADITSLDEDARKRGSALVQNRILLADAIGAREVVLHILLPYGRFGEGDFKERYYEQVFKTMDENEAIARACGVRVCVENMSTTPNEYQFEQFDRLLDRYDAACFGICCDTGHANLTDPTDPYCYARKYGSRMYAIHLNDNFGVPYPVDFDAEPDEDRSGKHRIIGDGTLDFSPFVQLIANSAYELPLTAEFTIVGEELTPFLNRSRRALEDLTQKVIAARNA